MGDLRCRRRGKLISVNPGGAEMLLAHAVEVEAELVGEHCLLDDLAHALVDRRSPGGVALGEDPDLHAIGSTHGEPIAE